MAHFYISIYNLGLATTWVGHFDAPKLKELFPEMADYELVAIFPVGYAAGDAAPSARHSERKGIEALTDRL